MSIVKLTRAWGVSGRTETFINTDYIIRTERNWNEKRKDVVTTVYTTDGRSFDVVEEPEDFLPCGP